MAACGRRATGAAIILVLSGALGAAPAPASRAAANIVMNVVLGTTSRNVVVVPRGGSAKTSSLKFKLGMNAENIGADPATVRVLFTLPAGLHWGADLPDATEECTSTESTADCAPGRVLDANNLSSRAAGWVWDVTADRPGLYSVNARLVDVSSPDSDPSDNSATATIAVTESITIGAARPLAARPKAGSVVSVRVRLSRGANPVTPTGVSCSARVGPTKVSGKARAAPGAASCAFQTRRSFSGKTLHGVVGFAVDGSKRSRAFAVRLR